MIKQSIFIPVYYYLAILTVCNNDAFTAHITKPFHQDAYEWPNGP